MLPPPPQQFDWFLANQQFDWFSVPPQLEDPSPSVVYVPVGGDLDLRCALTSVSAKEEVKFVWSFNFQEIPDLPSK